MTKMQALIGLATLAALVITLAGCWLVERRALRRANAEIALRCRQVMEGR